MKQIDRREGEERAGKIEFVFHGSIPSLVHKPEPSWCQRERCSVGNLHQMLESRKANCSAAARKGVKNTSQSPWDGPSLRSIGQATRGLRGQATRGLPGQGIWAEQKTTANPEAGRPPLWRGGRGGADPAIPPAWPARCSSSHQFGRRIGNHQRLPTALVGQVGVELRDPAEHLFTDAHICKGCADSPVRLPERGDSDTHRLGGIQTPTDSGDSHGGFGHRQTCGGAIGPRSDSRPWAGALKRGLSSRPTSVRDRLRCEGERVVLSDGAPK